MQISPGVELQGSKDCHFSTASVFPTEHFAVKISSPVLPHRVTKNTTVDDGFYNFLCASTNFDTQRTLTDSDKF